jgi:hypothetical protein
MIGWVASATPFTALVDGVFEIASLDTDPTETVMFDEVTVDPFSLNTSVKTPVVPVMANPLNVAIPLELLVAVVFVNVPVPTPIAAVTTTPDTAEPLFVIVTTG